MAEFARHTADTAPEASGPLIEASTKSYGMLPNLHAVLAESPETYEAYGAIQKLFVASSLSTEERHVVWLTINVANACHYCVPAHSFLALKDGVPEAIVTALREDRALPDARLEALRVFTRAMVVKRGELDGAEVDAFLAAGFSKRHVLDVILGLSHKVISNYVNHVAHTPVDAPFAKFDWTPTARAAE